MYKQTSCYLTYMTSLGTTRNNNGDGWSFQTRVYMYIVAVVNWHHVWPEVLGNGFRVSEALFSSCDVKA